MNYKIEEKQGFEMFGVSTPVNDAGDLFEQPFVEIPAFWTKCVSDGTVDRIRAAAGLGINGQLHGVLYNHQWGKFSYMIGYFLPPDGLPAGFEKLHIPTQTYAIFSTGLFLDGQSGVHELWRRIWGEWFPSSNYEFANGPEFEMTYDRGNSLYEIEVWIPVMKKTDA